MVVCTKVYVRGYVTAGIGPKQQWNQPTKKPNENELLYWVLGIDIVLFGKQN